MRLPVVGDPAALVRNRPVLLVGAGVALVAGYQLLRNGDAGTTDAATDATAPDTGTPGGLGGQLGSITYPSPSPSNGELADAGVVTPPAPAPAPAPTPKTAYLVAVVKAGTQQTYTMSKLANGATCSKTTGSYTTAGYTAEVRDLGTSPNCDKPASSRRIYLVLTGAHVGKLIARDSMASLTTKYR